MKSQTVYTNKKSLLSGFTLVEILVVLAIVTIILAIGAFANVNLFTRQISASEESTLVSVLSKARSRSMNNIYESKHAVHIENGSDYYVISNSSTSEKFFREKKVIITAETKITKIPLTDIVFEQLSGATTSVCKIDDPCIITLTDTAGQKKFVTIYENGLIDW